MSDRPDTFALVAFFLACAAVMAVGVLVLIHPTRNACDPKSLDRQVGQ